jgi:hypothetical protein
MTTTISGSSGIVFPDLTTMQTGQQAVKAWVNFNGTGTVAIRAAYNVSSITDSGTGVYKVNFTTAMVDANYCTTIANGDGVNFNVSNKGESSASAVQIGFFRYDAAGFNDAPFANVAIFR